MAIARLGYPVEMLTQVGNDLTGRKLKAELEKFGVQTENIKFIPNCDTGILFL